MFVLFRGTAQSPLSCSKTLGDFLCLWKTPFNLLCMLNHRLTLLCGLMTNQIIFCSALAVLVQLLSNSHDSLISRQRKLFTFRLFADVKPRVVCQPLGRDVRLAVLLFPLARCHQNTLMGGNRLIQLPLEKIIVRCQQSVLTFCDEIPTVSCRSRNCLLENVSHTSCLLNVLNISCIFSYCGLTHYPLLCFFLNGKQSSL